MTCRVCAAQPCFVHCVWCGVDCENEVPEHAADCPQSTGLYPANGEGCCACGDPVGEFYVLRPDSDWYLVVCVPCGVTG